MIKTLTKHGNSYALVIDKAILDLLKIRPDTPPTISTNGKSLIVSPEEEDISGVSGLVFCLFFEWCSGESPSKGFCECVSLK
jgi:hypothetical protein